MTKTDRKYFPFLPCVALIVCGAIVVAQKPEPSKTVYRLDAEQSAEFGKMEQQRQRIVDAYNALVENEHSFLAGAKVSKAAMDHCLLDKDGYVCAVPQASPSPKGTP